MTEAWDGVKPRRLKFRETVFLDRAEYRVSAEGWMGQGDGTSLHRVELSKRRRFEGYDANLLYAGRVVTFFGWRYMIADVTCGFVKLDELKNQRTAEDERNEAWSRVTEKLAKKRGGLEACLRASGWPSDVPTIDERLRRAQQAAMAEGDIGEEQHLGAVLSVFDGALSLFMKNPDRYAELFQQAGIVAREALAHAGDPVMQWPVPADAISAEASRHASRLYGIPPRQGD